MSVVISIPSIIANIVRAADAQQNWDIEHLITAVDYSIINNNTEVRFDVSNLGVMEAEQLYEFLTSLRSVFSEHEWNIVGQLADELVRFHGYSFCDVFETSELLSNIHTWYFNPEMLDEEDDSEFHNMCRDAALQHENIFG